MCIRRSSSWRVLFCAFFGCEKVHTKVHQVCLLQLLCSKTNPGASVERKVPLISLCYWILSVKDTYYFTDSCSWHAEEEQSEMPVDKPLEVLKIKMRHRTNINHSRSSMCLSIALPTVQCFLYSGYISNLG